VVNGEERKQRAESRKGEGEKSEGKEFRGGLSFPQFLQAELHFVDVLAA
jgi:hypothetical protein